MYALFAIGGICMFVIFGVLYYLSETLESEFALKGVLKGLVLAIPLATLCLSSFLAGKWIGKNKTRMKWLGFAGLALLTVSLGVIGLFDNIYVVVGLFTLGSAGIGATLPCLDALITEGVDKKQRGTITALFSKDAIHWGISRSTCRFFVDRFSSFPAFWCAQRVWRSGRIAHLICS